MDSTNNNTDLIEASDMELNNQTKLKTEMQQLNNDHITNSEFLFNKKTETVTVGFLMSENNNNVINNSGESAKKLLIDAGEELQLGNSPQEINGSNSSESIASPISDIKSVENPNSDMQKLGLNENKSNVSDLLNKLTESSSILSSLSSSSCVNSSGIGSTDLSPNHDYDLSRSPSSDTYLQHHQSQMIRKREGSVASQGSVASSSKFLDTKDGLGFLLGSTAASINGTGKKSRKEVIPQRKRRDFIPAELKDESYWERRRKNNLAAKRSREKRRLNDIVLETKVLELTNINNLMKLKFDLCIKKYNIPEDEIEKLFEENKHLLVVQESLDMSELLTNEDSLTPGFENEFEDKNFSSTSSYLSSSSSTSSGKRKSFKEDGLNDDLLISSIDSSSHHLTHSSLPSSKMTSDSCSISTSSSHHIGSNSSRRSNSSVDDADCEGFNDAMSENGLEIDENLDTIIESTDIAENRKEADVKEPKKSEEFLELINNDEDEGNCSPPSKRKSFFNPTHTSSCPSKSPSPTFQQHREEQMDNVSLSPIDSYSLKHQNSSNVIKTASDKLEKFNASYFEADKMAFVNLNKTKAHQEAKADQPQMKAQYPLLYNQLCRASTGSNGNTAKKTQLKQNQQTEITQSAVFSLEKQNQMLLNHIINNNNGTNNNPLMKSILNEISLRNELTKQQTNSLPSSNGTSSNISISTLLKQSETSSTGGNDILTKILSSSMSSSNNSNSQANTSQNALLERLGSLLKSPSNQSKESPMSASGNQANALMEKYKNLINKTNTQQTNQQKQIQQQQQQQQVKNSLSSNHSNRNSAINGQQQTLLNNQKTPATSFASSNKNTVNSLLQSFQAAQPTDQHPSKSKNQTSSSRKRHLNQSEINDQSSSDHLLCSNADLLAYAKQQQQQPSTENMNELVAMLLASQQNTHSFNNLKGRQPTTGNRPNMQSSMTNSKNSNTAKNQTYNQLLLMHQTQKLQQQQQRQNELNKNSQAHELTHLTSPNLPDQLAQLQASQYYYQQQAKFNMANGEINNSNNNNNNNNNAG